eukprot:s3454_g2.t1
MLAFYLAFFHAFYLTFCVALTALGWLWWRPWSALVAGTPRLFCVAGVLLGDICLRLAWHVWHFVTSMSLSCGRRGAYGAGLALVVALVGAGRRNAAPLLHGRRVQAWRLVTFTSLLRGRRATSRTGLPGSGGGLGRRWSPGASLAWQAWRLVASAPLLRGRHGAW